MTEQQEAAKSAYEHYSRGALQAVVNHIGDNPEVDRIWLYAETMYGGIATHVFCRYQGQFINVDELAEKGASVDGDVAGLYEDIIAAGSADLARALNTLPEAPQRIVTEYDPRAGTLNASWDYDVVKDGESQMKGRERWVEQHGGSLW